MVEISSQNLVYAVPIISAVGNFVYLKYINKNPLEISTIGISCIICLIAYIFIYLYGCTNVSADTGDSEEVKRLKQENAGLKSNLMKIHREVMPMRSSTPPQARPPPQMQRGPPPQQMQGPPGPTPQAKTKKIEEVTEGKVFSEAEDAKPFA